MTLKLTKMKLISLTCEHSVERRVVKVLQNHGIKSVRVHEVRIEELNGETAVDLLDSQIKIECVIKAETLGGVTEDLSKQFFPRFDLAFFVSDVEVLRPSIFCD